MNTVQVDFDADGDSAVYGGSPTILVDLFPPPRRLTASV
jgi:hypothetical protein